MDTDVGLDSSFRRIALVAPLFESVPPRLYGGTERVVADLAEELVSLGHDVTLYASGDSQTRARLKPVVPRALRLRGDCVDSTAPHVLLLERVLQDAEQYDVIHFHTGHLHFPFVRRCSTATLTTMHGRLDLVDLVPLAAEFDDVPLASISDAQRCPLPNMRWAGTVHNGLPLDRYPFQARPADYLAFLGRISPEKRPDRAIETAKRVGMRLKIAAKVDSADREYFERAIEPLLDHPLIEFVGEVNDEQKRRLLGGARALLFPIDWPEPFGLVMIEALACGTPVVAFDCGSVPEVIEDGVNGFIVREMDAFARATKAATRLERRACRRSFELHFTSRRMALRYLALYDRVLAGAPNS